MNKVLNKRFWKSSPVAKKLAEVFGCENKQKIEITPRSKGNGDASKFVSELEEAYRITQGSSCGPFKKAQALI